MVIFGSSFLSENVWSMGLQFTLPPQWKDGSKFQKSPKVGKVSFPNAVLGTPRYRSLDCCSNSTQLIQIINSSPSFDHLIKLCRDRAKPKTCTPWCPEDRVWGTLDYSVKERHIRGCKPKSVSMVPALSEITTLPIITENVLKIIFSYSFLLGECLFDLFSQLTQLSM
jgi:hypothetical protein